MGELVERHETPPETRLPLTTRSRTRLLAKHNQTSNNEKQDKHLGTKPRAFQNKTQLHSIWQTIAVNSRARISYDPVEGIRELFLTHVNRADLTKVDTTMLAHHVMRAWGEGLPMFSGFELADIGKLLQDVQSFN